MLEKQFIQILPQDNVAISISDCPAGTPVTESLWTLDPIPEAHKVALQAISAGDPVIRYGVILGYALAPIAAGQWINEFMLDLPRTPATSELKANPDHTVQLPQPPILTFEGFRHPTGGFAGTRNLLAIHTTVQCVTGVLNVAVDRIRRELLPKYPHVDGVVPINHAYGCGVAINAPDAIIPIRALRNLKENPNFGGELMVVALGCEKLTPDKLLTPEENTPENVITLQECAGFAAMIEAILHMADQKLARLNQRRRETLPLSDLCIGMQCGGSDAFSGITSNPSAGFASDLLISAGATVMFSEVTEVRDGVHLLAQRCTEESVVKKLAAEMAWYDDYLAGSEVDRSANPTPGNKKGGLSNIVEKAMGSIAKSGTAPIVEVLSPGERPARQGLIFAATPASDFVCGPMQLSSGITLQVFMTGRGTPYNLAAAPVIKVSSRSNLKNIWSDLIDVDAGVIARGESSIAEVGTELFHLILDVASGRKMPYAEQYNLANDLCIFNPAPIT